MNFSQVIDYFANKRLEEYLQEHPEDVKQPTYQIDDYSDDELYLADLKAKYLYQNAFKSAMSLNWCASFATVICSSVCILGDLSDISRLFANFAVGFIPLFYSACINLVLLFSEIKICKSAS